MARRLFISNLNYLTTKETLEKIFSRYGDTRSVSIAEGKGFGFVEFASEEQAKKAMHALNGTCVDGRTIRVDYARDNRPRGKKRMAKPSDEQLLTRARPGEQVEGEVLKLSLALKLAPTEAQQSSLERYFDNFASAVRWMLEKIPASKEPDNEFASHIRERKKQVIGKCPVCGREKKKDKRSRTGESPVYLKWKLKGNANFVCSSKCVLAECAGLLENENKEKGF